VRAAVVTVLVAIAGLAVARYAWGRYAERAIAGELARLRRAGAPMTDAAFYQPAPPAAENAVPDLIAAAELIVADNRGEWVWNDIDAYDPLDEEQLVLVAGLLRRLDKVWALLDRAERKPGFDWIANPADPSYRQYDETFRVSRIAPFLQVEAREFQQSGQQARALRCVERLLWLADAVGRAPDGHGESLEVYQSAARAALQVALALQLDGPETEHRVRAIVAKLLDEHSVRAGLIRALELRRMWAYEEARALADSTGAPCVLMPVILKSRTVREVVRPMILTDGVLIMRQVDRVLAAARVVEDAPTLLSLAPGLCNVPEAGDDPYWHLWAVTCEGHYDAHAGVHFRALAERHLGATALALRLYSVAHAGRLPARLDDLVPEYLPSVPADPMARGAKLVYRPAGDDPVLYSVGDDATDNGGNDRARPGYSDCCFPWSRPDVVVHLAGPSKAPPEWRTLTR
jgi:hypothetical protein